MNTEYLLQISPAFKDEKGRYKLAAKRHLSTRLGWNVKLPKDTEPIQSMANLLRQGATLTQFSCPVCSSPIFKLKSKELWCVKCQKRVVIVKEGTSPPEAASSALLGTLESTVLGKMQEIEKKIKSETDPHELQKLSGLLSTLLENLEKIRKMKRT